MTMTATNPRYPPDALVGVLHEPGASHFQAMIDVVRGDGSVERPWQCEHSHTSRDEATACGEAELQRFPASGVPKILESEQNEPESTGTSACRTDVQLMP